MTVGLRAKIWILKDKGKGFLWQARCGPEGSRRFKLPDFHDIWHMKVVRLSASLTGRLHPQECSWYPFSLGPSRPQGLGTVGRNMSLKNPVTPRGIDPRTVRLLAQRLNHYASPGPKIWILDFSNWPTGIASKPVCWSSREKILRRGLKPG